MPRTIKFKCNKCQTVLESSSKLIGDNDVCPVCSESNKVPEISTVGFAQWCKKHPVGACLWCVGLLIFVSTCTLVFILMLPSTDPWEDQYGDSLLELLEGSVSSFYDKDYVESIEMYHDATKLLDGRDLHDVKLQSALKNAASINPTAKTRQNEIELERRRIVYEAEQERLRQEAIDTAHNFHAAARVYQDRDKYKEAIAEYKKLADHVNNTEYAKDVLEPLSQQAAQEKLELDKRYETYQRDQKIAKANRERERQERARIERERRDAEAQKRALTQNPAEHFRVFVEKYAQTLREASKHIDYYPVDVKYDLRKTDSALNPMVGIVTYKYDSDSGYRAGNYGDYIIKFRLNDGDWEMFDGSYLFYVAGRASGSWGPIHRERKPIIIKAIDMANEKVRE